MALKAYYQQHRPSRKSTVLNEFWFSWGAIPESFSSILPAGGPIFKFSIFWIFFFFFLFSPWGVKFWVIITLMVPEWVTGDFFRGVTHRHWFLSFFIIWIRYPVNITSSFWVLTEKKDFYGRKGKKNTKKYGKNYTGGPCDNQCGLTRVPYASKKISQHFDWLKGTWYQYDLLIVMFDWEIRLRWRQKWKKWPKMTPSKMTQKSNLTDLT